MMQEMEAIMYVTAARGTLEQWLLVLSDVDRNAVHWR